MAKFHHLETVFPEEYLKATLMISLLTVWVLVGLFYYLNRYTRRDYFAIWTAGWLFYALWLTMSINIPTMALDSALFMIKQSCVSLSAVFLLWGSLRFLGLPVRQSLFGMFMLFVVVWTCVSPQVMTNMLQIQLPVFILLGSSSLFAGFCFFRLRKQKTFVGAGMLSLGFFLWGIYLGTYPVSTQFESLYSSGFFISAVLQLFIAVSMIVLVLEEVRDNTVQKERLQAIGEMAIRLAHDVNNALCPITGYAEILDKILPKSAYNERIYLSRITAAGQNVAQIVARMRDVYRREINLEKSAKAKASQAGATTPAPSPAAPAPAPSLDKDCQPCRSLRILYIDDEPGVRELVHDVLELYNHKVTLAASGKEGLEMFRSNLCGTEAYEVVITDLGMPENDGRMVARALREVAPQLPIIILTGWGTMMESDTEPMPEVAAVLSKPPHMQELNSLLIRVTTQPTQAALQRN